MIGDDDQNKSFPFIVGLKSLLGNSLVNNAVSNHEFIPFRSICSFLRLGIENRTKKKALSNHYGNYLVVNYRSGIKSKSQVTKPMARRLNNWILFWYKFFLSSCFSSFFFFFFLLSSLLLFFCCQ